MKRLRISRLFLAFAIFIGFTVGANQTFYAATPTDLADLQTELTTALADRQPTYSSSSFSGSAPTGTQVSAILDDVFGADDYLHYATKSYKFTIVKAASTWSVDFTFTYWETKVQTDAVSAEVTNIVYNNITGGMNDFEKQKTIHDWIVTNVAYDGTQTNHSAYAALFDDKITVCQGYALLAYKLFTEAGIENKIIEGTAGGQLHTWNLVKLDGNWYHFDTTWDDPLPDVPGRVNYDYYNLTDDQIKVNHSWTKTYPAAVTDFAVALADKKAAEPGNAAFYSGLETSIGLPYLDSAVTASDTNGVIALVYNAVAADDLTLTFRHTKKSRVNVELTSASGKFGNISAFTYKMSDFMPTTLAVDVIVKVNLTYTALTRVDSVALSPAASNVDMGKTLTLTPTVDPVNASLKSVTWSSSDDTIASVNSSGVVTGVSTGTTTISAKSVDGDHIGTAAITVVRPVASIALDAKSKTIKVGAPDVTLNATVLPVNASDLTVTWTSSDTAIATVDSGGVVHPVAPGKATITAKSSNNLSSTALITVPVAVADITLNKTSLNVDIKKTAKLVPTIAPTNAAVKTVTWSSSDPAIATVSTSGTITGKALGNVTITATSTDDGTITETASITVLQPVTSNSLNTKKQTLRLGGSGYTLVAAVGPTDASDKTLTWTSSKTTVATVDSSGVVTAVAAGKSVVSAKSVNGKTASATITVVTPVTGITLNKTTLALEVKKSAKLLPIIAPANATLKSVAWTSSDAAIATVSSAGTVTGRGPGSATVTAKSTDDPSVTTTATVTVTQPVTGITFNARTKTMQVGDPDYAVTATVNPGNASDPTLTWTSSNAAVATVDSSGNVHAVAPGKAVIKATAASKKYMTATITVKP